MSIAAASDLETAPARPLVAPLVCATNCVALADWLFYGWDIGISLAVFLGALGLMAIFSNRVEMRNKARIIPAAILLAGLLPVVEQVSFLSVAVATVATAMSIVAMTSPRPAPGQDNCSKPQPSRSAVRSCW